MCKKILNIIIIIIIIVVVIIIIIIIIIIIVMAEVVVKTIGDDNDKGQEKEVKCLGVDAKENNNKRYTLLEYVSCAILNCFLLPDAQITNSERRLSGV
jgi:heme/copper-type cytochrome/quinol oxidase subunit 2